MIIYFSGGGNEDMNEWLLEHEAARLVSFAYERDIYRLIDTVNAQRSTCKLLVDSGAFTAWSKGKQVDIERLADCFTRVQSESNIESLLINLDVIPGSKGVNPTPHEIMQGMEDSLRNFDYLNKIFPGKLIPVYHQGEPLAYRDKLMSQADYICISPRNDLPERQRIKWCQEAQSNCKIHGLATTGMDMMHTVDWYSVDSAVWIMAAAMGEVILPSTRGFRRLSVSDQSSHLKTAGKHLTTLPEKDVIIELFKSKGFNHETIQTDSMLRQKWNASVLLDYQNSRKPTVVTMKGLFDL